jgi:LmbE family N-acetylglucosaminyl deacetylase
LLTRFTRFTRFTGFTRFTRPAGIAVLCVFLLAAQLPLAAMAQAVPWATTLAPAIDATTLPEDRGADGLAQTLNKLRTWASLMMIVAHPDDEDGGMMAYESRGAGVRTSLLTLTRGEGGQNAMSGESYDALGLIRTNELLAADRYSGTEQIWGTEADYGFSKTKEEAFSQWTHERVLRDVVRAVREQRPLVLTSVFIGGITDGHGHHQVAGQLAQEAFNAAGDPGVFPDQIAAGLLPWKPLAVYARSPFAPITARGMYDYATDTWAPPSFTNYVTGEHTTTPPKPDVAIQEGAFDPVLGRSYLQMAREGWGLQKSQNGGGNPPLAGPDVVTYHRYGTRIAAAGTAADASTGTAEPLTGTTDRKNGTDSLDSSFFTGIDTSLPGMIVLAHGGDTAFVTDGLLRMERAVTHAFWGYTPAVPDRIAPDLVELAKATQALLDAVAQSSLTPQSKVDLEHELRIKLVQCNTALVEALGLHLDALVTPTPPNDLNGHQPRVLTLYPELSRTHVTPGETFDVRLHIASASPWSSSGSSLAGSGLSLVGTGLVATSQMGTSQTIAPHTDTQPGTQAGKQPWQIERTAAPGLDSIAASVGEVLFQVTVPQHAAPTQPYFTRPSIAQAFYDLSDPKLAGRSLSPYPLSGYAEFNYDGVPIRLVEVVQGVERERGPGTLRTPLVVTPGLSVNVAQPVAVLPAGKTGLDVAVSVTDEATDSCDMQLRLQAPAGWQVEPTVVPLRLAAGERATQSYTVTAPANARSASLHATAQCGNRVYSSGFITAGYPGLRPSNLYAPAQVAVHAMDVRVAPGVRVGYVMGTGDEVPAALRALGVPVDLLTPAEVRTSSLSRYTALVLGVRAYTADPALAQAGDALQAFARQGGTVVIQYQSSDFPGLPYPLHLGNNPAKVVDERSPVTLLAPQDSLLKAPNSITSADFDGWFEERGHGFASDWAPQWTPLIATADPAQAMQNGGLLVSKLGTGLYIYDALALYRQLPEGVAGAYRLLANLVSATALNR